MFIRSLNLFYLITNQYIIIYNPYKKRDDFVMINMILAIF